MLWKTADENPIIRHDATSGATHISTEAATNGASRLLIYQYHGQGALPMAQTMSLRNKCASPRSIHFIAYGMS